MKQKNTVRRTLAPLAIAAVTLLKTAQPVAAAPLALSLGVANLKQTTQSCVTDANTVSNDCMQSDTVNIFETEMASFSAVPVSKDTDKQPVVVMDIPEVAPEAAPGAKTIDNTAALFNEHIGSLTAETEAANELKQADAGQLISGLNPTRLFELINAYRAKRKLPALLPSAKVCSAAEERAPELFREIFVTNNMHAGFYARQRPYKAVENMIHFGTEEAAVGWWLRSRVHHAAIVSPNYTHTCVACKGNSCAQIFAKFEE